MPSKVMPCTCRHEYQDKTYGKGQRLHNQMGSLEIKGWRCTACGDQKAQATPSVKKPEPAPETAA